MLMVVVCVSVCNNNVLNFNIEPMILSNNVNKTFDS